MTASPTTGSRSPVSRSTPVLWACALVLAALATVKLRGGFERLLLWREDGAIDLLLRYDEVGAWFAGYWIKGAVYPPASQAMLWPIVGWMTFRSARALWALLFMASLVWLSILCMRESGARSTAGRVACAFLPLALNSTASSVGIGQLVLFFLPVVVTSVLWMVRRPPTWPNALATACLFTLAALKPTLFAPFAWLVLVLGRSWKPAILSAALYAILTLGALAALHPVKTGAGDASAEANLAATIEGRMKWATEARPLTEDRRTQFGGGYGNLQNMSQQAGLVALENFVLPVVSVLLCGAWTWRHRRADPWILLGVCALAARLGWYHRVYDDALLLLPMIALVRIASSRGRAGGADDRTASRALWLLGATVLQTAMPATFSLFSRWLLGSLAIFVWLADLWFLATVAPALEIGHVEAPRESTQAEPAFPYTAAGGA